MQVPAEYLDWNNDHSMRRKSSHLSHRMPLAWIRIDMQLIQFDRRPEILFWKTEEIIIIVSQHRYRSPDRQFSLIGEIDQ